MSRRVSAVYIDNARFRPKLKRKPTHVRAGKYIYCPTMLTKCKELEIGATVKIIEIRPVKKDPCVIVCDYSNYHESGKHTVFWEDLRR